jgi:hypothetical protein
LTDITLLKRSGWHPSIDLETGISMTYRDFQDQLEAGALRAV